MDEQKTAKIDIAIEPSVKKKLVEVAKTNRMTLTQFIRPHIYAIYAKISTPDKNEVAQ